MRVSDPAREPVVVLRLSTSSTTQTRSLAAALAAAVRAGDRLALIGPAGAGKTQFAKGFAAGLGVREVVNSPSFTLMAEYAGRVAALPPGSLSPRRRRGGHCRRPGR